MAFKWYPFTKNQLKLLSWWMPKSPYKNCYGIIADGAVRSGKTLLMSVSFILWAFNEFNGQQFGIAGKSISSLRRNLVNTLIDVLKLRGFKVIHKKVENVLIISKGGKVNTFFLFGGLNEKSQDLVQGVTLAGILLDEVALMPRSFVEQCMARCSVEGAKYWFNCNPDAPLHWFNTEHVKRAHERNYLHLHFSLDDNPSLSEDTKSRYQSMFTGVFYQRFILGLWVAAQGVIYDCFDPGMHLYTGSILGPILRGYRCPTYSCDYGTTNPQVYLKAFIVRNNGAAPHVYIEDEYYYSSKLSFRQKTDAEYVQDFYKFHDEPKYKMLIIDPSAESFYVAAEQSGIKCRKANNAVLPGIKLVHTMFSLGLIHINEKNCPNLIQELGSYSWDEKKTEQGKEDAPVKTNDHCCDALRYLIYTCIKEFEVYAIEEKERRLNARKR